jgi:hypothetical protein
MWCKLAAPAGDPCSWPGCLSNGTASIAQHAGPEAHVKSLDDGYQQINASWGSPSAQHADVAWSRNLPHAPEARMPV